jgi:hypothetical protein
VVSISSEYVRALKICRVMAAAMLVLLLFSARASAENPGVLAEQVLVGFGIADVALPAGVPLAGYANAARRHIPFSWSRENPYAFFFKPSTGVHDPIQARAMVLQRGSERLVFVRLDLIAVSAPMESALRARLADLQIADGHLVLSATHTHSGPGAFADSLGFAIIATDYYQQEIFDRIVASGEQAVRRAVATTVPARLFSVSLAIDNLQFNRRDRKAPVDRIANLLLARADDGRWLGGIINFAIHPTALPPANLQLSADIPGAIERHVSDQLQALNRAPAPVVLLFINGALGDIAPAVRDFKGIERAGEVFANRAMESMPMLREVSPHWTVATATVDLGQPRLALSGCLDAGWPKTLFGGMRIPLNGLLAGHTPLQLLRLGDIAMMSWPGEPTSALGSALRQEAARAGARQVWVLGLTGDYKYYFTTAGEFKNRSYESCNTVFGADAGQRIVDAYRELLGQSPGGLGSKPPTAEVTPQNSGAANRPQD